MFDPRDPQQPAEPHRKIARGDLLVATPSMRDPNFRRSVILICDHDDSGTFGLVINRPTDLPLQQVLPPDKSISCGEQCVHFGGPVDHQKIFALRHGSGADEGEEEVGSDLFMPGDLERSIERICNGVEDGSDYLFFLGYSGWERGQLQQELQEKSWVIASCGLISITETPADQMWSTILREMGGEYTLWSWLPDEPDWN